MPIIYWNNKPLWSNGKPAWSLSCCCGACYRTCIVVRLAMSSLVSPEPAGLSGNPPSPSRHGESSLVWHCHSYDTLSPKTAYHTHVWLIEYKWTYTSSFGVPPQGALDWFSQDLDEWAGQLGFDATGDSIYLGGDYTTQVSSGCFSTFPDAEKSVAPLDMSGLPGIGTNFVIEDLYGPVTQTAFPDCEAV